MIFKGLKRQLARYTVRDRLSFGAAVIAMWIGTFAFARSEAITASRGDTTAGVYYDIGIALVAPPIGIALYEHDRRD